MKGFIARVTGEAGGAASALVLPLVLLEERHVGEGFVAQVAFVRLLSSVDPEIVCHIIQIDKKMFSSHWLQNIVEH